MNKITLPLSVIVAKVKELAEASPLNRYNKTGGEGAPGCSNLQGICTNGSQGCIIGQALLALGVNRELLADHEYDSVRNLLRRTSDLYNEDTFEMNYLVYVQLNQDAEQAWGLASHNAQRMAELLYV